MSAQNDFLNTLRSIYNYAQKNSVGGVPLIGAAKQPLEDLGNAAMETGQSWADVPGQIASQLSKTPLQDIPNTLLHGNAATAAPVRQMSPSAQRGLNTVAAAMAPLPSMDGAMEGAGYLANQGKSAATNAATGLKDITEESLSAARAQPGGLQAGFIDPGASAPSPSLLDQFGNPMKEPKIAGEGKIIAPEDLGPLHEPTEIPTPQNPATEASGQPRPDFQKPTKTYSPEGMSKEDILASQKRNIQLDGRDIQTPQQAAQINATLNGYGIKGSATKQLQMTNDTIEQLANNAKKIIAEEGGVTPRSNLIDLTAKNMSYSGNHAVPQSQILPTATNYVDSLYARATGADLTKSITGAPEHIPDTILADMKKLASQDSAATFDRTDPTKWTANQATSRFARNALDTTLDAAHPNASTLNNDMKDLYDAQDTLRRQANIEGNATAKAAAEAPTSMMGKIGQTVENIAKNPIAQVAGAGELFRGGTDIGKTAQFVGGALSHLPDQIANKLGYTRQGQGPQGGKDNSGYNYGEKSSSIHGIDNIPKSMDQVNIYEDLPSPDQVLGKDGQPMGINPQAYKDQKAKIDAEVQKYTQLGVPVQESLLKKQAYINQSDPSSPTSLYSTYKTDKTAFGAAANVAKLLKTVSPNFFNQFKSWDDFQKNTDSQYSGLKAALQILHDYSSAGTDNLFTTGSADAAKSSLEQVMENIKWHYLSAMGSYSGSNDTISPAGSGALPPLHDSPLSGQSSSFLPPISGGSSSQGAPSSPNTSGGISGGLPNYQFVNGQWVTQ